ncbi:uncharacterized protein LOC130140326 isoform X5 [Syzygium oleosum]|uniref:uncharacterized protein LOC130140326 isoform X5 n=1 Tax=Syzygium oleosum TaxID=219896 RepID=UPI0024BAEB9E|nr:uncharacterized protein LOC130140326 isoform X5 [Syzygium oleosum]
MNGDNLWSSSDREPLVAPIPRVMPGWPKQKRIREEGKFKNGFKVSRQCTKITCHLCFKRGHYSRSCPLKQKEKDEEIVGQREANSLVMEMHHNSATTQKPRLEGSRAISLLRNTNHDVDNAKKVESASRKFITTMGLQRPKANIMKRKQEDWKQAVEHLNDNGSVGSTRSPRKRKIYQENLPEVDV